MITKAILGYPGVGKTWAVYEALKFILDRLAKLNPKISNDPMHHIQKIGLVEYHTIDNFIFVGRYDGSKFQGTDRLSMAVAPHFASFFDSIHFDSVVIAEGDRINTMKFLKEALLHGSLERIRCTTDSATLKARRLERDHAQPPAFLKTIQTKVDKHNFDQVLDSDQLLAYLKTL